MLKRKIKITQDGSKTLFLPEWNESYHSKHGALQEAEHVFISHGLNNFLDCNTINVLEFGFGTGLNALLSYIWSSDHAKSINYTSLEKYPITSLEMKAMDFNQVLSKKYTELQADTIYNIFLKLHQTPWHENIALSDYFLLHKLEMDFLDFSSNEPTYDLVFFDVFGRRVQPEFWTEEIFEKLYHALSPGGLFTTYASNGHTQRALQSCGFLVEKLPGPPGKREMINAWKK